MTSQQPIDCRTPIDFIEPQIDVRNAGTRYLDILEDFGTNIKAALATGNIAHVAVTFWSGSYALGRKYCDGISMTERARKLGVERATISKGATRFVRDNNLLPSFYMKDKLSSKSYIKARLDVVVNGNGHKKWPLQ